MAYHNITTDLTSGLSINATGDSWDIAEAVSITYDVVAGMGIDLEGDANRVRLYGQISDCDFGIHVFGNDNSIFTGENSQVTGDKAALIFSGSDNSLTNLGIFSTVGSSARAVQFFGANSAFINKGSVLAVGTSSTGIYSESNGLTFENHGAVTGANGIVVASGAASIVNAEGAAISGSQTYGVDLGSSQDAFVTTLTNLGSISGDIAVDGSVGNDTVINRGSLSGNISLDDGNDVFVAKGGTWTGSSIDLGNGNDIADLRGGTFHASVAPFIHGGAGNDCYILGNANFAGIESTDNGFDTIKVSTSFVLGDNFEHLVLLGIKNASATGNEADNVITGNRGDNVLDGMGGEDTIDGGGGIDTLTFNGNGGGNALVSLLNHKARGPDGLYTYITGIENLRGTSLADTLNGDGGDNLIEGGGGADTMTGGDGRDTASYRHSSAAIGVSLAGGPKTGGDAAGDILIGFENLEGSAFGDTLSGDGGKNRIAGMKGNDVLAGLGGKDVFVFSGHFGRDTIEDFGPGDRIDFSEGAAVFKNFADLMAHVTTSGEDLVIHHGQDRLTLLDTAKADLQASDFLF